VIIASNFKTNFTRATAKDFILHVENFVQKTSNKEQIRIYPTATALDDFDIDKTIKIGAQNFYPADKGSFTGEVGFEQLEEFGVDSVLVGHSERRHVLKDSSGFTIVKYNFAKEKNVEIIYCVGEPKEIREAGIDAVMAYIWEQFDGIDIDYDRLVVAYEPVWAIGTGLTASAFDIEEVLQKLREKISKPLLYGGSVKAENCDEILNIKNCDGVLVGTASWNVDSFCKMIEAAQKIK